MSFGGFLPGGMALISTDRSMKGSESVRSGSTARTEWLMRYLALNERYGEAAYVGKRGGARIRIGVAGIDGDQHRAPIWRPGDCDIVDRAIAAVSRLVADKPGPRQSAPQTVEPGGSLHQPGLQAP